MAKRHRDRHHINKLEELLSKHEIEVPALEEFVNPAKHVQSVVGVLEGNTEENALHSILYR